MDDDKIRALFNDFQPELSSSDNFILKLQKNMEMVEFLREQSAALKKRQRLAVGVAAVSGFVMGVILTILFPTIENWIKSLSISMPQLRFASIPIDYSIIGWVVIAAACIFTAINVYEITLARLKAKETYLL
ncbi:MAG: hypothetical protein K2G67_00665 [Muribaculaceae bacterium]|nr:hypothetical protein [Muribaculaceae bacterium]